MPNRWAEEPDPGELKSDLNPLLNPVLEENLGRWAQVYFTNPPETRERAVMDLLRDLENPKPRAAEASAAGQTESPAPEAAKVSCAICNGENRAEQRFCGYCGTPLRAQQRAVSPAQPAPETLSFLGLAAPSAPPENDLEFLREKSFEKSYYEPESGSRRGLYVAAAVLILLGGATYLSWPFLRAHFPTSGPTSIARSSQPAAQSSPALSGSFEAVPPAPSAAQPEHPAPMVPQAPAGSVPEREAAQTDNGPHAPAHKNAIPAVQNATARTVTLSSDAAAGRAGADGTQELLLAQRYLRSGATPTNTAAAARWLWKSVSKQNPHAALLLADLYARGDGVSKSCDQARMLLGAAAKKGLPDAGAKLRALETGGCR